MPRLGLITACQFAVIEQDTKAVSLINLFTGLKISIQADQLPPSNAVAPKEWFIACGWDGVKDDEGKVFDQLTEILLPDGKPFVTASPVKFSVQPGKRHYMTSKILAFPIGQVGKCTVQVWAEFDGQVVTEKSTIHIGVEHDLVAASPQP
jgi:hypothetical protein